MTLSSLLQPTGTCLREEVGGRVFSRYKRHPVVTTPVNRTSKKGPYNNTKNAVAQYSSVWKHKPSIRSLVLGRLAGVRCASASGRHGIMAKGFGFACKMSSTQLWVGDEVTLG